MQSFFRKRWLMAIAALALAIAPTMAQAAIVVYNANLAGSNEAPPNASLATGLAVITFDDVANTMRVQATFSGLNGNSTAAHIHAATASPFAGTAGVATTLPSFAGLTLGSTSGSMDQTYDMTLTGSYNPAYITANGGTTASAFSAMMTAAFDGKAYFNVHSQAFPGGEIRGFLITAVPEPSSMVLTGLVLGAGVLYRQRSRKLKVENA